MNLKKAMAATVLTILTVATAHAQGTMANRPPLDEPLDLSQVNNRLYSYDDIATAKAAKMSDDDVARILKIARRSGVPFRHIVEARIRGETFVQLAQRANVSTGDLNKLSKEKDELAAYESAYFATGSGGMRHNSIDVLLAKAAAMKPKQNK